mgnify:FL=1
MALVSGAFLGKTTFDRYKKVDSINVISNNTNVYALRYGKYANLDEMQDDVTHVDRYIYIESKDDVSAYVALATTRDSINKIKKVYKDKNLNLTVSKVNIENEEFIENLNEYEKLLKATDDYKSLLIIENQILSCYMNLVVDNE